MSHICLANLFFDLDEIRFAGITYWFVEGHVEFILFNGEKCADKNFMKYTINIGLGLDTCEPVCYKLCMVLDKS